MPPKRKVATVSDKEEKPKRTRKQDNETKLKPSNQTASAEDNATQPDKVSKTKTTSKKLKKPQAEKKSIEAKEEKSSDTKLPNGTGEPHQETKPQKPAKVEKNKKKNEKNGPKIPKEKKVVKRGKGKIELAENENTVSEINEVLEDIKEKKVVKRGKGKTEVAKNENKAPEITGVLEDTKEKKVVKRGKGKTEVGKNEIAVPELTDVLEDTKQKKVVKRGRGKTKVEDNEKAPEISDVLEDTKRKKVVKRGRGKKEEDEGDLTKKKLKEAEVTNKKKPAKRGQAKTNDSSEVKKKVLQNNTLTDWKSIDFNCAKVKDNGITHNLIISTWNVGGIRSWIKKGCLEYLKHETPDILCLQETKCTEEELPEEIKSLPHYKQYWLSSKKGGYAGVGLLTIKEPRSVTFGIKNEEQDEDGRCITAEYDKFFLVNVYVPNAGRNLVTLPKRLKWNEAFKKYILSLDDQKPVIICGDLNVAHNEIDLARPKSNTKNAGFTPEEREGMTDFLDSGFIDTFRYLNKDETDVYSFWSYMGNARSKNIGWRLDYFVISKRISGGIHDTCYRNKVLGSDHCPVTLFVNV